MYRIGVLSPFSQRGESGGKNATPWGETHFIGTFQSNAEYFEYHGESGDGGGGSGIDAPFEAFKIRTEAAQGLRHSQPPGDVSTEAGQHSDTQMLTAITAAQLQDVVSLADRLCQARRETGHTQSPDEVLRDPERWELTDYLYSLSDEARRDLILLMLVGRGDVRHASERAAETCLKYRSADDQVAYLMSKSVRLTEYLKIGMLALVAMIHRQRDALRLKPSHHGAVVPPQSYVSA